MRGRKSAIEALHQTLDFWLGADDFSIPVVLGLLKELAPDEEKFYAEGAEEAGEEIEKLTKW